MDCCYTESEEDNPSQNDEMEEEFKQNLANQKIISKTISDNSNLSSVSKLSIQDIDQNLLNSSVNRQEQISSDQLQKEKKNSTNIQNTIQQFINQEDNKQVSKQNDYSKTFINEANKKTYQLRRRILSSRLNVDISSILHFFKPEGISKNCLSSRFDEVEQEFITLNRLNHKVLDQCGYTTTLNHVQNYCQSNSRNSQQIQKHSVPMISFRKIYENQDLLSEIYGKSLKVELIYQTKVQGVELGIMPKRFVHSYLSKLNFDKLQENQEKLLRQEDIFDTLYRLLLRHKSLYNFSIEEIVDTFLKVSGDLSAMKHLLEGKRVIEWSSVEDLALGKEISHTEFSVLIKTKGQSEIDKRKEFLRDINSIYSD
eukprot:403331631